MDEFEVIYKEYFRDVFLYIKGLSREEHIAEEITQETFFHAMKAIRSFRGDCDIRVWLCQIAKNEYYTYLRKNKRLTMTEISNNIENDGAVNTTKAIEKSKTGNLEKQLVDSETAIRIHKLLHDMQEPYKEVFQLRVFGELSFEQIGDIFGKNANWACVTYHRARAKIQKEMEEK